MGYWQEKLKAWGVEAEKRGLVDVKFFSDNDIIITKDGFGYAPPKNKVDLEAAARAALRLLEGTPHDVDVSDQNF